MREIRPMGAVAADLIKREVLFKDDNYIAETKHDGSRYVLQIEGNSARLTSRTESTKGGMVEKSENVPHIIAEAKGLKADFILDGEIDIPSGRDFHYVQGIMGSLPERAIQLQQANQTLIYYVFDILQYDGKDLRALPLDERRRILREKIFSRSFKNIVLIEQHVGEQAKRSLLQSELKRGMEGIMLKNINSVYTEDKKPANCWYKVKKVNTFDGIVTSYIPGNGKYVNKLGALVVKQYVGKELKEVATASGMTDAERDAFKLRLDKGETIIIEFAAQDVEIAHLRYRHPRYIRERLDKNPKDCIYGKA